MRVLLVLAFAFTFSITTRAASKTERIKVGPYQSRAIVNIPSGGGKKPVVIMLPGSGPSGPEEISLAKNTVDGQVHPLFNQLAQPLNLAGAITLQLGKPGIEFYNAVAGVHAYDQKMYLNLTWTDLINNVSAAVELALKIPQADPKQIYILGHSEGTQVAVDYAAIDARIKGLILLGYTGLDFYDLVEWQFYVRPFEMLIVTDVDADKNKIITKAEVEKWPEVKWNFAPGQTQVSISAMQQALRLEPQTRVAFNNLISKPLYQQILHRGPIFGKTANLKQDLYLFTGELDVQTHPREARQVGIECQRVKKKNCAVFIVPELGHGFSPPRGPRHQVYLDATIGPISPSFQNTLYKFASELFD